MDIGAEFYPLPVLVLNHPLKYPAAVLDDTVRFRSILPDPLLQ